MNFKVVCDRTNNTEESIAQGYLVAEIYLYDEPYYVLYFEVDKDGKVIFK